MTEPGGIVPALVKFQASLPRIERTSQAQYGKYADLSDVVAVLLPRLAAVGLCYSCASYIQEDGGVLFRARLLHTSGEVSEPVELRIPPSPPQTIGGYFTYFRRYGVLTLTGCHPVGEDDDAQEAQKAHDKLAKETVKAPRKATRSSGKQPDDEWTVTHTPPPGGTGPRPKGTDVRSAEQSTAIFATLGDLGMAHDHDRARALIARLAGWDTPKSTKELTRAEAGAVIDALADIHQQSDPQAAIAAILGEQEQLL